MDISLAGLSSPSVWTIPIRCTILIPAETRPNMVCAPSSHGVGASVIKLLRISHRPTINPRSERTIEIH